VKRLAVLLALSCALALGACSGDDDDAASSASSTTPSTTAASTTTSATGVHGTTTTASTAPDTVATGACSGAQGFAEAAVEWAGTNEDPPIEATFGEFTPARADPTWARAALVPDDRDQYDTLLMVGHCDGKQWVVVDAGTSGVGCGPQVPAAVRDEIGVECN
jgi:hypothetical protein